MNIRELAKEAGVSVATISRVINHPEAVLPETRERVQTIIEKYNYNPTGRKARRRASVRNITALTLQTSSRREK